MEYKDRVPCPIIDGEIDAFDCILVSDATDGQAPETVVPERFAEVKGWKDTCLRCPYHDKTN